MDLARKFVVKQLAQPGKRNVSGFPSEWHFAENQRIGNLEFFNRIGQKQLFRRYSLTWIKRQLQLQQAWCRNVGLHQQQDCLSEMQVCPTEKIRQKCQSR
jgi:hypothetical protein